MSGVLVVFTGMVAAGCTWSVPVLRGVAIAMRNGALGAAPGPLNRFIKSNLEYSLIAHLPYVPVSSTAEDAARIYAVLRRLRPLYLTQLQLYHEPHLGATLLTGLGWCDQVNGVAVKAVAREFGRAETFAVYDSARASSPHTIARTWSAALGDWLYFDAYFSQPLVFRLLGNRIVYLPDETGMIPEQSLTDRERPLHDSLIVPELVRNGYTMEPYGRNTVASIAQRLLHRPTRPTVRIADAGGGAQAADPTPTNTEGPANGLPPDEAFERVYLQARLALLAGEVDEARILFARAASYPNTLGSWDTNLRAAARIFELELRMPIAQSRKRTLGASPRE